MIVLEVWRMEEVFIKRFLPMVELLNRTRNGYSVWPTRAVTWDSSPDG